MSGAVNPFDIPGRWLRGNTHAHSAESDGAESLPDRFARYRDAGYDFLVMTDHGVVSDVTAFSESGFLAISGTELHPENPFGGDSYHIVAVNVTDPIPFDDRHPQDVLDAVAAHGGISIMAHPSWSGFTLADFRDLTGYCALEVYNETCWLQNGKGQSENTWDDHLDRLGPVWGIAADDVHHLDADACKAWIMLRAPSLTTPDILEALRSGAFFSTQGPEFLDIRVETDAGRTSILVQSSPVRSIVFKGRARWGAHLTGQNGQLIQSARYDCHGKEKYVRIELTDQQGRKAWSNPFFLPPPARQ
jgi:hypothetical protein